MKLKFKHQPFQEDAARAVCAVFEGQQILAGQAKYLMDVGGDTKDAAQGMLNVLTGFCGDRPGGRIQCRLRARKIRSGDGGETATVQAGRLAVRRRILVVNRAQARFRAQRRFGAFRVESTGGYGLLILRSANHRIWYNVGACKPHAEGRRLWTNVQFSGFTIFRIS